MYDHKKNIFIKSFFFLTEILHLYQVHYYTIIILLQIKALDVKNILYDNITCTVLYNGKQSPIIRNVFNFKCLHVYMYTTTELPRLIHYPGPRKITPVWTTFTTTNNLASISVASSLHSECFSSRDLTTVQNASQLLTGSSVLGNPSGLSIGEKYQIQS